MSEFSRSLVFHFFFPLDIWTAEFQYRVVQEFGPILVVVGQMQNEESLCVATSQHSWIDHCPECRLQMSHCVSAGWYSNTTVGERGGCSNRTSPPCIIPAERAGNHESLDLHEKWYIWPPVRDGHEVRKVHFSNTATKRLICHPVRRCKILFFSPACGKFHFFAHFVYHHNNNLKLI